MGVLGNIDHAAAPFALTAMIFAATLVLVVATVVTQILVDKFGQPKE